MAFKDKIYRNEDYVVELEYCGNKVYYITITARKTLTSFVLEFDKPKELVVFKETVEEHGLKKAINVYAEAFKDELKVCKIYKSVEHLYDEDHAKNLNVEVRED